MRNLQKEIFEGIGLESIAVIVGASFAGMGRAIGGDYNLILPVLPIAMDLGTNGENLCTPKGIWALAKYSLGVGLVYVDKIYPIVEELINYGM